MSKLLVFAGPNGSGKSTITSDMKFFENYVNADSIKKGLHCSDLEAAQIAEATREHYLAENLDFAFETVLSTTRNIDLMIRAKEKGYHIACIYVLTLFAGNILKSTYLTVIKADRKKRGGLSSPHINTNHILPFPEHVCGGGGGVFAVN